MNTRQGALLALFMGCVWVVGCAQGEESTTDEDYDRLDAFVEAALHDEISVEEARSTYESLDDSQRDLVRTLVEDKTSTFLERENETVPDGAPALESQAAGANWQQSIENVWTYNYQPKVFSSYSYVDWNCDDDPSDKEYVFYYPYPSLSPSLLRWTSTSAQVYIAFMAAYGGNLLGFGYNKAEARLCIGDNGVAAAGGAAKVKASVFVHY